MLPWRDIQAVIIGPGGNSFPCRFAIKTNSRAAGNPGQNCTLQQSLSIYDKVIFGRSELSDKGSYLTTQYGGKRILAPASQCHRYDTIYCRVTPRNIDVGLFYNPVYLDIRVRLQHIRQGRKCMDYITQ